MVEVVAVLDAGYVVWVLLDALVGEEKALVIRLIFVAGGVES